MKKATIAGLFILLLIATLAFVFLRSNNETIDPEPAQSSQKLYIALGDSVAAGVGLPDASDSSACNRTDQGYPNLLAGITELQLINKSCSGARSQEGLLKGQTVNNLLLDPQLLALDPLSPSDLITITIGANDIGWVEKIQSCYLSDCTQSLEPEILQPDFALMQKDLSDILAKISSTYSDNAPQVIVSGYYQLFANSTPDDCADRVGLSLGEIELINVAQTLLDTAIQDATAPFNGVKFAKLSFQDHGLCSTDPWVQGLNDRQPFHPNEKGQAAISEQIAALVSQ